MSKEIYLKEEVGYKTKVVKTNKKNTKDKKKEEVKKDK